MVAGHRHSLSSPRLFVAQLACKDATEASSTQTKGGRCEDGGTGGCAGRGTNGAHVPHEARGRLALPSVILGHDLDAGRLGHDQTGWRR